MKYKTIKMKIRFENTLDRKPDYEHNFLSFLPFIILVIGTLENRLYFGWFCFTIVIRFMKKNN